MLIDRLLKRANFSATVVQYTSEGQVSLSSTTTKCQKTASISMSISPTFYEQLLCAPIPKAKNRQIARKIARKYVD